MSTLGTPPPSTPAYPDLIVRMRGGDVAAFELVFRDMHAPLVAFAVRYVNDRARAEELVQDLFFDLWQHRARCQVRNTLRSYLFAALRNRALNLRRRDAVESDWTDDEAHDSVRVLHPTPTPADVLLIAVEERQAIEAAFARLPERCRLAMHLRWREGMSYGEIADVLGIRAKSVENQLARGLRSLRAMMRAE